MTTPDARGAESAVEVLAATLRDSMADRCDNCLRVRATDEDWDTIEPGDGEHLCWAEWSSTCDAPDGDLFTFLADALAEAGIGPVAQARAEGARDALLALADDIDTNGYGWSSAKDAGRFKARLRARAAAAEIRGE